MVFDDKRERSGSCMSQWTVDTYSQLDVFGKIKRKGPIQRGDNDSYTSPPTCNDGLYHDSQIVIALADFQILIRLTSTASSDDEPWYRKWGGILAVASPRTLLSSSVSPVRYLSCAIYNVVSLGHDQQRRIAFSRGGRKYCKRITLSCEKHGDEVCCTLDSRRLSSK